MLALRKTVSDLDKAINERPFDKEAFLRRGKIALKALAKHLELENYDVRSCAGGPAVRGDVVLHTPSFYVMVCGGRYGRHVDQVMFRTCNGMSDYCGGRNEFTTVESLATDEFHAALRVMMARFQKAAA